MSRSSEACELAIEDRRELAPDPIKLDGRDDTREAACDEGACGGGLSVSGGRSSECSGIESNGDDCICVLGDTLLERERARGRTGVRGGVLMLPLPASLTKLVILSVATRRRGPLLSLSTAPPFAMTAMSSLEPLRPIEKSEESRLTDLAATLVLVLAAGVSFVDDSRLRGLRRDRLLLIEPDGERVKPEAERVIPLGESDSTGVADLELTGTAAEAEAILAA